MQTNCETMRNTYTKKRAMGPIGFILLMQFVFTHFHFFLFASDMGQYILLIYIDFIDVILFLLFSII